MVTKPTKEIHVLVGTLNTKIYSSKHALYLIFTSMLFTLLEMINHEEASSISCRLKKNNKI